MTSKNPWSLDPDRVTRNHVESVAPPVKAKEAAFIEPIEVGDYVLQIHSAVVDVFGGRIAVLINRDNGEIREQMVYEIPTGPRWRKTVEKRMRHRRMYMETPLTLINKVK